VQPALRVPADRETLAPEVRFGEPALALFPPDGPYSYYRRLAGGAPPLLREGGSLIVEIGAGMATEVERIVVDAGFTSLVIRPDLQGIPRAVIAVRA
jgi:release factor glutamine methyltransferase